MGIEFGQRYRWHERPAANGAGIYAYILITPGALAPVIRTSPDEVIYVGMTESSLDARCHFEHEHSGFSTLRRSLGAILNQSLTLHAVPRSPGPSKSNVQNFRFDRDGEARLTGWMQEHLLYAHVPLVDHAADRERDLVAALRPALNLTGWPNPHRNEIKRLRAVCVAEARQSAREVS